MSDVEGLTVNLVAPEDGVVPDWDEVDPGPDVSDEITQSRADIEALVVQSGVETDEDLRAYVRNLILETDTEGLDPEGLEATVGSYLGELAGNVEDSGSGTGNKVVDQIRQLFADLYGHEETALLYASKWLRADDESEEDAQRRFKDEIDDQVDQILDERSISEVAAWSIAISELDRRTTEAARAGS